MEIWLGTIHSGGWGKEKDGWNQDRPVPNSATASVGLRKESFNGKPHDPGRGLAVGFQESKVKWKVGRWAGLWERAPRAGRLWASGKDEVSISRAAQEMGVLPIRL